MENQRRVALNRGDLVERDILRRADPFAGMFVGPTNVDQLRAALKQVGGGMGGDGLDGQWGSPGGKQ